MAGQDATKSISEVKAQIARTSCDGSAHQGPKGSKTGASVDLMKKQPHQG